MKARMGAIRTLGLGAVTALVVAGLGAVATPASHAADPVLPAPDSPKWIVVKQGGNPATDATNDFTPGYLNLTPAEGTLGAATAFASADLQHAYFRFHIAEAPTAATATQGYVVQFDTNNAPGWERAIRFEPVARTVEIYNGAVNSAPKDAGTLSTTVPLTAAGAATYPGAAGGAYVAFSVPRAKLTNAGIILGRPMVMGASNQDGAALDGGGLLGLGAKADILGVGKGAASWTSAATDPLDLDSDGDGIADNVDNCPVNANPLQEDDDEAIDNSLPSGTVGQPDGTEGKGNACDRTPRGYDLDEDGVGLMDDQCPERPGLQDNGCVARSTTTAILRYLPRATKFTGVVRADYEQCVPRRTVSVYKFVLGAPDRFLGSVKTDAAGRYVLDRRAKPKRGKYYSQVDRRTIFDVGVNCFAVKSPKIEVR